MSAPVTERVRSGSRTAAIPAQRAGAAERSGGRAFAPTEPGTGRRSAQKKAYARREDRLRRATGGRSARAAAPAGRPQFVLLVMTLLAVALVATLWLSTAAAADSYRLEDATAEARKLSQQAERLHQEVAVLQSPPELARRAAELGMMPVQDPARLVVASDGTVSVVGEPRAAVPPPPPEPPPAPARGEPGTGTDANGAEGDGAEGDSTEDSAEDTARANGTEANGTEDDSTGDNGSDRNGTEADGTEEDGADEARLAAPAEDAGTSQERSGQDRSAPGRSAQDEATAGSADRAAPGDGGTGAG